MLTKIVESYVTIYKVHNQDFQTSQPRTWANQLWNHNLDYNQKLNTSLAFSKNIFLKLSVSFFKWVVLC